MFHPGRVVPLLLLLPCRSLPAQVRAWVDADVTRVESDAFDDTWGATLAPTIRLEPTTATTVALGAAYGRYSGSLWALQGTVDATVTPRAVGALGPELSFSAAALTEGGGGPANFLGLARGRLHWAGARAGVWGGGGGGVGDDGTLARGVAFADLGGWAMLGPATLSGSVLPTRVASGGGHLDAELGLNATWRRAVLSAGAGRRWWRDDGRADESWASVGLEWRALGDFALTATAGRFPSDPLRGFGDGRYLQFGIRLGRRGGASPEGWALRTAYRTRPPLAPPVARAFEVHTLLAARTFVVRAPGATRVELAGDFTDWLPVPLVRGEDGTWRLELFVPAGSYRFNLRVDDGPWGAPRGVPTIRDDFGGVVGLLVLD